MPSHQKMSDSIADADREYQRLHNQHSQNEAYIMGLEAGRQVYRPPLVEKEKEIRKMKPVLTIRKKVEIYESLLAPELRDPKSVFNHAVIESTNQLMDFHEAKWRIIISKTGDARIDRLNGLIAAANIPPTVFCRTMGSFFLIASGGIHLPNLSSYTKNEMECILREEFEIYDETTISCITQVLMEV